MKILSNLLCGLLFITLMGCTPIVAPTNTEPSESTAPQATEATATQADSELFPVTITHSLGTVEIPDQPERVIALSTGDTDIVYALGITPIAIHENNYEENRLWPWLAEFYDPAQTEILPAMEVSIEHLLELQPDIILAGSRWNTAELYENLAEIAPTLAVGEGTSNTWQEKTLLAGRALGLEAEAQAAIDETEAYVEAVRQDYPELEGKTFSLSYLYNETSINSINSPKDSAVQFFLELGFIPTPGLAELAEQEDKVQAALSLETLNLIDGDLVVIAFGSPEVQAAYEANPLYQQLEAVQEGRVVVVNLSAVTALRSPSVLGIRWVVDQLRPAFKDLAAASE